jgi:hypothetical protein
VKRGREGGGEGWRIVEGGAAAVSLLALLTLAAQWRRPSSWWPLRIVRHPRPAKRTQVLNTDIVQI